MTLICKLVLSLKARPDCIFVATCRPALRQKTASLVVLGMLDEMRTSSKTSTSVEISEPAAPIQKGTTLCTTPTTGRVSSPERDRISFHSWSSSSNRSMLERSVSMLD
jgi:hypothetical protein